MQRAEAAWDGEKKKVHVFLFYRRFYLYYSTAFGTTAYQSKDEELCLYGELNSITYLVQSMKNLFRERMVFASCVVCVSSCNNSTLKKRNLKEKRINEKREKNKREKRRY